MPYPRTCRNGHVIVGEWLEHHGAHRQCQECRWTTQRAAQERYRNTPNGSNVERRGKLAVAIERNDLALELLLAEYDGKMLWPGN